jgi:hypothetical protein
LLLVDVASEHKDNEAEQGGLIKRRSVQGREGSECEKGDASSYNRPYCHHCMTDSTKQCFSFPVPGLVLVRVEFGMKVRAV